jgi:hypothetical protein
MKSKFLGNVSESRNNNQLNFERLLNKFRALLLPKFSLFSKKKQTI